MEPETKHEAQRRFIAKKKEEGLKRLVLWVRPEDAETVKLVAQQPHALAQARREISEQIKRELKPKVEAQVGKALRRKTERAMLAQKRKAARIHLATSNAPPELIRFEFRPPATVRNRLKSAGWLYDPVAAVWHVPENPNNWPEVEKLLAELEPYSITKLQKPRPH